MSLTDSKELGQLRQLFKEAYRRRGEKPPRASPERLGRFARDRGARVTDFGAHSMRWRARFLSAAK